MLVKCALPYATGISESVLSSFSSFSSSIKQTQNNDLQACHCTVLPTYVIYLYQKNQIFALLL